MALRLDGYVRVSRIGGRQGEGYISPDVQREAIERYATELGGEVIAWHDDQDYGGGNLARPGFQVCLDRLAGGETDGIVVKCVDRFARSVPDGAKIVREVTERGQVIALCDERIDPKTPDGLYMLHQFLNNAELFLNRIKAGWIGAKERAIARGAHIGPTPIGYSRIGKGEERPGTLVPHPTYGPAIKGLFRRAAGRKHGDSALARWMTERAPRESGAPWNPSEIRRWLSNRVYLGEVHYGELVNPEAHKALTTESLWRRCQREPGIRRAADSPFLLRGLIRCASCRYAMGGQTNGGSRGLTPIYRCPRSGRGCSTPSVITAARVESYVVGEALARREGILEQTAGDGPDEAVEMFDAAEREVEAFVTDLTARRLLGEDGWQEGLRVRVAAREALRAARDGAIAAQRAQETAHLPVDEMDRHDLRDLLVGMVSHIFVRRLRGAEARDRALIVWGSDLRPVEVPGPHRPGPFGPITW